MVVLRSVFNEVRMSVGGKGEAVSEKGRIACCNRTMAASSGSPVQPFACSAPSADAKSRPSSVFPFEALGRLRAC